MSTDDATKVTDVTTFKRWLIWYIKNCKSHSVIVNYPGWVSQLTRPKKSSFSESNYISFTVEPYCNFFCFKGYFTDLQPIKLKNFGDKNDQNQISKVKSPLFIPVCVKGAAVEAVTVALCENASQHKYWWQLTRGKPLLVQWQHILWKSTMRQHYPGFIWSQN